MHGSSCHSHGKNNTWPKPVKKNINSRLFQHHIFVTFTSLGGPISLWFAHFVFKVWMCLAVRLLLKMRTVYNWSLVFENCAVHYQIMKPRAECQEVAQINCDGLCDLWTALRHTFSLENRKRAPPELNKTENKMDRSAFHTLVFSVASRWWLCSWWNVCVNSFLVWPLATLGYGSR